MKIETKFNVFQKVWILRDHKAVEVDIQQIKIQVFADTPKIEYWVEKVNLEGNLLSQSKLFATKEALLESL